MKQLTNFSAAFTAVLMFVFAATAHGQHQWTNFAGMPGGFGNINATGGAARFQNPLGVALDTSGNIFVADYDNHVIRKVTPAGEVTTFAGTMNVSGLIDGTGTSAQLNNPAGLAIDSSNNLFVADSQNNAIRKITPAGVVTTLAGGTSGHADGTGAAATFLIPIGITVDGSGNVYVADTDNFTIRKITSAGVVTTLAGTAGGQGSADGTGAAARFNFPQGIIFDATSNCLYVADTYNSTVRKVTLSGVVTTFAGTAGSATTVDGTGSGAGFNQPYGIGRDSSGNLYVVDGLDHVLRKITPAAVVSTLAGSVGMAGNTDGTGTGATFETPYGVAADASGNLYVSCFGGVHDNSTLRKVTPAGVVTTLAGSPTNAGSADGTGSAARFFYPSGLSLDSAGNLYIADLQNFTIRKATPAGVVTTVAGSPGQEGYADGNISTARFSSIGGAVPDASGNLFVADAGTATVRKISAAGVVTTIAGDGAHSAYVDATGTAARFSNPVGIVLTSGGDLLVADPGNNSIRRVTQAGVVTTFVGSPTGVGGSADGTGTSARFDTPNFLALDASGNLYVTDTNNCTIRKVTPAGVVTTVAGSVGVSESVDGTGSAARFNYPIGITIDASGNLYVTEFSNTIRMVTPAGVVTTIGGTPGLAGGADGTGAAAQFNFANTGGGIVVSPSGTLYVADVGNNRISKGAIASNPPTVTTPTSASITATGATLGGNVTSDGGATITERGVVYSVTSTNSNPQISGSGVTKVTAGGTTGVFTAGVSSLTAGTGYSYAAYATNSAGTSYSSVGILTTLSNNASLSSLVFSAGTLSPVFAAGTTSYAVTVLKANATITVTPTVAESHATVQVRVNGGSYVGVASGSASGSLSLNLGDNPVDVHVTAQDGTTTKTYTTTVTRWTNLQNWRNQFFSTIANSGNAADTMTPQNDGLTNLMKFAMGLDPTKNVRVADGIAKSGNSLQFNYQRNIDAIGEVTFIVEWSDTLQSNDWHTTGVTESILSATSTLQQVQATVDVTGLPRRFMRLRVTDP